MSRPPFTDRDQVRQTVSLRLPRHLLDRVDELARRLGARRTDVVETALDRLLGEATDG